MMKLIDRYNIGQYGDLMESVYRFRHRFFVDHMKWEALRKPDGREIDQFDTDTCVHLVGVSESGAVTAYSRLLPTTEPHLMSHVFSSLLEGAEEPVGPDIWEWTRAAVAPERRDGRSAADRATAEMMLGVTEACLYLGIRALQAQTHPQILPRMIELGWKVTPLALPAEFDGQPAIPVLGELDEKTLLTSRQVYGVSTPVLQLDEITAQRRPLPQIITR